MFISIPFTWNLPDVKAVVRQRDFEIDNYVVGGSAVNLMPDYFDGFDHVSVSKNSNGILQKINPLATRTTVGCPNRCPFCGVQKINGKDFIELNDWPDLPVLIDNNLLAGSVEHFDKVIDRLIRWGWCDFNQGLDVALLNQYHAMKIAKITKPMIRLAYDSYHNVHKWSIAFSRLLGAGIKKINIRSYVLIGYDDGPAEAWDKCNWIENHGIKCSPMWFHPLNVLEYNGITENQRALGWNNKERTRIMGFFYKHRGRRK